MYKKANINSSKEFLTYQKYTNYPSVLQRFASMKVLLLLCCIVVCQASSWSGNEGGACILNTATQPDKNLEKKHLDPTCNSEADAIAYSVEVNTHTKVIFLFKN